MIISLDVESTGLDVFHGSKPFIVTTCNESRQNIAWQWDVNPLTRQPIIPSSDLEEIYDLVSSADEIVFHNSKFDIHMLQSITHSWEWDWTKTQDTLVAAHVLCSNMPKDLTNLASMYLDKGIRKHEEKLENEVKECTKRARKYHKTWRIADKSLPEMPSNKKEIWRADYWLPRAIAVSNKFPDNHPYYTTVLQYANVDSACTLALWMVLKDQLMKRDLWEIYKFRLDSMRLAFNMEHKGISLRKSSVKYLLGKYKVESTKHNTKCIEIAKTQGYDISMPKRGVNDSLRAFYEEGLKLPAYYSKKNISDKRSYDKEAMTYYREMLEPGTALDFIKEVNTKSNYDSSIVYLRDYLRFSLQDGENRDELKIHSNFNPTATNTLRWGGSNPNPQNIKKDNDSEGMSLRSCFGPKEGREWWSLDAKNVELRIPFYESGEQSMIDLFEKSNEPPYYGSNHILIFSVLWPDLWADAIKRFGVTGAAEFCKSKEGYKAREYQWTKNGNFAIQYGSGRANADRTYHKAGAYDLINSRFENLRDLNIYWTRFANEHVYNQHNYVETLPDRTINPRRGYPLNCTKTDRGDVLSTIPLSYHVQGTAMQITARAMMKVDTILDDWRRDGFDAFITLQVHDEIVIDCPRRENPKVNVRKSNLGRMRIIQKAMESCGEDLIPVIPIPFGLDYHSENWGTAVTF